MNDERLHCGAACDRLDRPPADSSYVDLPPSFGRRFAVSVDTEEEFDWSKPPTRDRHGTNSVESLPNAHRRLVSAGVKPAYLIDYPIASDPRSVAILRGFADGGECTIGTQLHPWVNPPFDEELSRANSFTGNLPIELERSKLLWLTEEIERGFGRRPTIYRAGRYGVGANTARLLVEAGYEADVSARPLFDYSREGGPDFSAVEPRPYWAAGGALLEVPLTAAYLGLFRGFGRGLYRVAARLPRATGLLARTGLLSRVALTPEGMPLEDTLKAIDWLLEDGLRLFSISFHSPSVEPGHTPYVRDQADLARFYGWWDGVLDHFAGRGVAPASYEEIIAAAHAARAAEPRDPSATRPPSLSRQTVGPVAQR